MQIPVPIAVRATANRAMAVRATAMAGQDRVKMVKVAMIPEAIPILAVAYVEGRDAGSVV